MSERELEAQSLGPVQRKYCPRRLGARWLAAATAVALAHACTTPADPSRGATMKKVGGDNQTFIVGRALPQDIVVKISGKGLAGLFVSFTVTEGAGSVDPSVGAPDANGLVRTVWTLGPSVGTQRLVAFTPGQLLSFTATASAPSAEFADALIPQGTLPAKPKANDALIDSVMVADVGGAPVVGDTVVFTVTEGGGTVNGRIEDSVVTDESGLARIQPWQLGTVSGTNTLTVESVALTGKGTPPTVFTVVATSSTAHQLGVRTAPGSAVSGVAFFTAPVIEVRDSFENVFNIGQGSPVTVRAAIAGPPAGARLVGKTTAKAVHSVATFDSLGVFGPPGTYQLQFTTATGLTPAQSGDINVAVGPASRFTSTVEVAPPALTVGGGPAVITVTVRDDYGSPVSGVVTGISTSDAADVFTQPGVSDELGHAVTNLVPGGPYSTDVIQAIIGQPIVRSTILSVRAPGGSLSFVLQPAFFITTGKLITPAPQVAALDPTGALLATFSGQVTISAPGFGGRLGGTTTVGAVKGVAHFGNLVVTPQKRGYQGVRLFASSSVPLLDQSAEFNWFNSTDHLLVVLGGGTGNGRVVGARGGCDILGGKAYGPCFELFIGQPIHLSAQAANGSVFLGWSGACTGVGSCTVEDAGLPQNVTAAFR